MSVTRQDALQAMRRYRVAGMERCLVRLAHGIAPHRLSRLVGDLADEERQLEECAEAWSQASEKFDRVIARIEADFDKNSKG